MNTGERSSLKYFIVWCNAECTTRAKWSRNSRCKIWLAQSKTITFCDGSLSARKTQLCINWGSPIFAERSTGTGGQDIRKCMVICNDRDIGFVMEFKINVLYYNIRVLIVPSEQWSLVPAPCINQKPLRPLQLVKILCGVFPCCERSWLIQSRSFVMCVTQTPNRNLLRVTAPGNPFSRALSRYWKQNFSWFTNLGPNNDKKNKKRRIQFLVVSNCCSMFVHVLRFDCLSLFLSYPFHSTTTKTPKGYIYPLPPNVACTIYFSPYKPRIHKREVEA